MQGKDGRVQNALDLMRDMNAESMAQSSPPPEIHLAMMEEDPLSSQDSKLEQSKRTPTKPLVNRRAKSSSSVPLPGHTGLKFPSTSVLSPSKANGPKPWPTSVSGNSKHTPKRPSTSYHNRGDRKSVGSLHRTG